MENAVNLSNLVAPPRLWCRQEVLTRSCVRRPTNRSTFKNGSRE
jgi:hypothetical protein